MTAAHDRWWQAKTGFRPNLIINDGFSWWPAGPTGPKNIPVTGGDEESVEIPIIFEPINATPEELEDLHDFIKDCGKSIPITPKEFIEIHRQGKISNPHRKTRNAESDYDRAMKGM